MSRMCDKCEYSGSYEDCWAANQCINGSQFKLKKIYSEETSVNKQSIQPTHTSQKYYCPFCGEEITELINFLKKK